MAHMRSRGRQGGPWHSGRADTRGPSGRARAIRDAVNAGAGAELLRTVMRTGEPWRDQLALFELDEPLSATHAAAWTWQLAG